MKELIFHATTEDEETIIAVSGDGVVSFGTGWANGDDGCKRAVIADLVTALQTNSKRVARKPKKRSNRLITAAERDILAACSESCGTLAKDLWPKFGVTTKPQRLAFLRRLNQLVKGGKIVAQGVSRARRYHLPTES
jgi:hypothetical protein